MWWAWIMLIIIMSIPIFIFSYWLAKSLETMADCDEEIKKCQELIDEKRKKDD